MLENVENRVGGVVSFGYPHDCWMELWSCCAGGNGMSGALLLAWVLMN